MHGHQTGRSCFGFLDSKRNKAWNKWEARFEFSLTEINVWHCVDQVGFGQHCGFKRPHDLFRRQDSVNSRIWMDEAQLCATIDYSIDEVSSVSLNPHRKPLKRGHAGLCWTEWHLTFSIEIDSLVHRIESWHSTPAEFCTESNTRNRFELRQMLYHSVRVSWDPALQTSQTNMKWTR
jgi:hypothetical protein